MNCGQQIEHSNKSEMENKLFNELAEKMMKGEITRKQATKSFETATKKKVVKKQVVKKQELTAEQASFEAYKRFVGRPNLTLEEHEKETAETIIKIAEMHRRWRESGDADLIRRLDEQEWRKSLMNKSK